MTMRELAREFNISDAALSNYENGKRKPDIDMLGRLADFFGVTTDYLLGRSDQSSVEAEVQAQPTDPEMAFGATLKDGMSYEDLNPKGKAELYEYYQYLKQKYPKDE